MTRAKPPRKKMACQLLLFLLLFFAFSFWRAGKEGTGGAVGTHPISILNSRGYRAMTRIYA